MASHIQKPIGLRPNIKLGQIFLIDEQVVDDQISFAELTKKDTVLEIGPGLGALTIKMSKLANKVIAIEYDKRLYLYLKKLVPKNVELIYGDARTIVETTATSTSMYTLADLEVDIIVEYSNQTFSDATGKIFSSSFYTSEIGLRLREKLATGLDPGIYSADSPYRPLPIFM